MNNNNNNNNRECKDEDEDGERDEMEMLARESKEIDAFVEKIVKVNGVFSEEEEFSKMYRGGGVGGGDTKVEGEGGEEDAFQGIIKRVNKYQEKCEMLDEHLEKWIVPLTEEVLRFHAVKMSNNRDEDDFVGGVEETTTTTTATTTTTTTTTTTRY